MLREEPEIVVLYDVARLVMHGCQVSAWRQCFY